MAIIHRHEATNRGWKRSISRVISKKKKGKNLVKNIFKNACTWKKRLFNLHCVPRFFMEQRETKFLENSPRTMPLFHFHLFRLFGIGLSQPDSHVCNCKLFIVSTTFHFPVEGGEEQKNLHSLMEMRKCLETFNFFLFFFFTREHFDKIWSKIRR